LTSGIVHDVTVGVDGTGIRAGVIGEIGCSYPLIETEAKVLEAVADAQRITGAPVNIHPGRSQSLPLEIIDMYRGFGGDIRHTAMSHLSNRHGLNVDLTIELAETGYLRRPFMPLVTGSESSALRSSSTTGSLTSCLYPMMSSTRLI